jgi:hypothetical protein
MKKIVLLTVFIASNLLLTAQNNTIAKFKFEEAEEAYVNNDFRQTIEKLNEAEELLKSTNPKISHLRISAQSKLIDQDPISDYSLIENTRKLSDDYLKNSINLSDEDKYREIYIISENLKQYPTTSQEFEEFKEEFGKKRKQTINIDLILNNSEPNVKGFMNYQYYEDFKMGLSLKQTYDLYPNFKDNFKVKDPEGGFAIAVKGPLQNQPNSLVIKNNTVIGYYIILLNSQVDDSEFSFGKKAFVEILNKLKYEFLFSPEEIITDNTSLVNGMNMTVRSLNYTWSLNQKIISLVLTEVTYNNENLSTISFFSRDENLIKEK